MSRKRLSYCDVCRRKIMPLTDADWSEGKAHYFQCKRGVCEPKEEDLEAGIELVVKARKRGFGTMDGLAYSPGYDAVDLCQDCVERMLREVLGPTDVVFLQTISSQALGQQVDGGNEDE